MIRINEKTLKDFALYLAERECSPSTRAKYSRDVRLLGRLCQGTVTDKGTLIAFKEELLARGYAASSVNSMLAAVNRFVDFAGRPEWKLRYLKVQREAFASAARELTVREYGRMVSAARTLGDERSEKLVQTICATGIRVGEVRAITVESLRSGQAEIRSKGKIRRILLPGTLCRTLLDYCARRGIETGAVFVTRTGRPLDRSNIWKTMKRLAAVGRVRPAKAFPHNLRHLFARTYYKTYKDIVRLADILGHTSVDTTRIYTARSGQEQQRQIERLPLLY